jgi:hypothetical protein
MKRTLLFTLAILALSTSLQAKQNLKEIYNSKQLKYRDIKAMNFNNERSYLLKNRDAITNRDTKISFKDFRSNELSRQSKQLLLREARNEKRVKYHEESIQNPSSK